MLAILAIRIKWYKKERNLKCAVVRQQYSKPVSIEEGVNLSGSGVFLVKCNYCQQKDSIQSDWEASEKRNWELDRKSRGRAFTGSDEREQRYAARRVQSIQKAKGAFYKPEEIDIPCIAIIAEENESYRIQWYDGGIGMPVRKGGNADCYKEGAKLAGKPNLLNETAFVLQENEAGILRYNYRCISFDDPWYECYYVYIVNEKKLKRDIFLRNYQYQYKQIADLF